MNQDSATILRGPGYFRIDMSLAKTLEITERQALHFQWDTYNVTNAVRFDVARLITIFFTRPLSGEFQYFTKHRVMQFGLRYSF